MSGHDLSELWIALRTALLADTSLTALLASNSAIYRGEPEILVPQPFLEIACTADNPQQAYSFTGIWRPDLSISCFAKDQDRCEAICSVLDSNWTIPVNRVHAVSSTTLRLTYLRRSGKSDPVPVRVLNTNESLYSMTTFWRARVVRRST